MARIITPLTDNKINTTKPQDKNYKLFDGGGLFLLVKKNGIKSWRLKYKRPDGRENELAFGNYPDVTLKEARDKREKARALLAQGIDPSEEKKKEKALLASGNTFQSIAMKWIEKTKVSEQWSDLTTTSRINRLEKYVFPLIGTRIINTLKLKDFVTVINHVINNGVLHVPTLIRGDIVSTMRFAILSNIIETNPAVDLVGLKLSAKRNHHPALAHNKLKELLDKIDTLEPIQRLIVLINLHVFIRSSELRFARWDEIDFKNKIWTIPESREAIENVAFSNRGGKKRAYIVPLTDKVISLLEELKQYTGDYDLVFTLKGKVPINNMFINLNLRALGYDTRKEVCGHGFRTMACSALAECGFSRDAVEKQMSHEEQDEVRGSYTHLAEHLEERINIMQWWSDYLDYSKLHGFIPPYEFKNEQPKNSNIHYLKTPFIKVS